MATSQYVRFPTPPGTVLPTGAATAAKQDTGNTSLASIDGKLAALGQKTMAGSEPVVIASDQSAVPISGTVTATNSANGATAAAVPAQATQVAGSDGTNLRALKVSSAGVLSVDGSAVTQPVSGTITANIGTSGSLALDASVIETHGTKAAGVAATKSDLVGGVYSSTLPVMTTGQQAALQTDPSGRLIPGVGANGSGSAASATVSTVITLTAPAGANGFYLMNLDTSGANVRWAIGRTATTALGQQLQPGRDTGFVQCSHDVSLVAESGTQNYDIQWIQQ